MPGQPHTPAVPAGDDPNLVTFPAVTTTQVRVTMTDQPGDCSGITELEAGNAGLPGARLWIDGATATSLSLNEGQASAVTTTYWPAPGSGPGASDVSVHLVAPAGWTVRRPGGAAAGLRPGR